MNITGKFNAEGSMIEQGIKTGGLNGTGASAVNFTCEQFVATITKNGKQYALGWEKGQLTTPLTDLGQVEEDDLQNGTLIELIPDMSIWVDDDYNIKDIVKRLEQLTFLNPGLTIYVDIDYNGKKINETYCNPEGLKSYIDKLSTGKEVIIEPIHDSFELESDKFGKVDVDIALGYNNAFNEEVYTFTNNVPNPLGGHHLTGFKQGLFASINNYYEENTKGKLVTLTQDDVREGIISVISVKVSNPVFDGQGKAKLNMPGIRGLVKQAAEELMNDYLDKNPNYAKIIIAKALQAQSTREAIRKTREAERGTKKTLVGVPDKLSDCAEKSPEKSELWLAEGDSAGGSCKKARFNNQAILPIFGKINNVEKGNILNVLESEKLKDVVKALKTGIGEEFDIDNLRYHKIIIAADADVDGLHIQTLWITFFYRFMRQIIENGHLYISCPPLYKVVKNKNTFEYCYTDEEKDKLVKEYGRCEVFRYKGLEVPSPYNLFH